MEFVLVVEGKFGKDDYNKALTELLELRQTGLLTVYFGAPSMFITLWFGFDY
jgi:hypothetical protein